jgi:hypothetical protein
MVGTGLSKGKEEQERRRSGRRVGTDIRNEGGNKSAGGGVRIVKGLGNKM